MSESSEKATSYKSAGKEKEKCFFSLVLIDVHDASMVTYTHLSFRNV